MRSVGHLVHLDSLYAPAARKRPNEKYADLGEEYISKSNPGVVPHSKSLPFRSPGFSCSISRARVVRISCMADRTLALFTTSQLGSIKTVPPRAVAVGRRLDVILVVCSYPSIADWKSPVVAVLELTKVTLSFVSARKLDRLLIIILILFLC